MTATTQYVSSSNINIHIVGGHTNGFGYSETILNLNSSEADPLGEKYVLQYAYIVISDINATGKDIVLTREMQ